MYPVFIGEAAVCAILGLIESGVPPLHRVRAVWHGFSI